MLVADGSDKPGFRTLAAELLGVDCCNGAESTLLGDVVIVSIGKPEWDIVTGEIKSLTDGPRAVAQEISPALVTG